MIIAIFSWTTLSKEEKCNEVNPMRADISCSSAVVLATPTEPTDNDLNIGQHSAGSVFLSTSSSCVYMIDQVCM